MSDLGPFDELDPATRTSRVTAAGWATLAKANIAVDVLGTFDAFVPRDPRLLVPVDVQAYVSPDGATGERADVRALGLDTDNAGRRMPPPFSTTDPLLPGIHLHWALPDGLTRADPERPGLPPGDLGFRPLPDRWLVVRLGAPLIKAGRRALTAWVVESGSATVTPLPEWVAGPAPTTGSGVVPPDQLHPGTGGDPAWAAVYDNVVGRFGFHDPLAGVTAAAPVFSYVVVGWYSDPARDPLFGTTTLAAFTELHAEVGWEVDLSGMDAAASTSAIRVLDARRSVALAGGDPDMVPTIGPGGLGGGVGPDDVVILDPDIVVVDVPRPSHPRQSLYHGVVHGVVGRRQPADGRPALGSVDIGLGPTLADATGRLLADDDVQETVLAALGHRLTDHEASADGWSALDSARHQRAFLGVPDPAPPVLEKVRRDEGAGGTPVLPRSTLPGVSSPAAGSGAATTSQVRLEFLTGGLRFTDRFSSRGDFDLDIGIGGVGRPPPQRVVDTIARPGPRYWQPTDLVVVLGGLTRSLRHGHDGRFEPGDTLACRLTGQPVSALKGVVLGTEVVPALGHGGIPPECDELVREAALTDPTGVTFETDIAVANGRGTEASVQTRLEAEVVLDRRVRAGSGDAADLLAYSLKDGVLASPLGVVEWRQPWVPIYLEWEAVLDRSDRLAGWRLDELDLVPVDPGELTLTPRTFTGRSLLAGAATKALADSLVEFLDAEDRLDATGRGVLTEAQESQLATLVATARSADLCAGTLAGMHDRLLGFDPDALASGDPIPTSLPELLRGGFVTITRLRVVDAFGQHLDLTPRLGALAISGPLADPAPPAGVPTRALLAPRITAPSRVSFRLIDAADDAVEALVDETTPVLVRNPVAGYLLPDHADDALEIFGPDGTALGQLYHRGANRLVTWEDPPGVSSSLTPGPGTAGAPGGVRHLAALTEALVRRDTAEREAAAAAQAVEAAGGPPAPPPAESPLAALLRVIDTTLWSTDPFGSTGTEHTSVLLGRPVAVVRATLGFDIIDDPDAAALTGAAATDRAAAFAALADRAVTVRLGSLTRFDDGLLGFFVDDDYSVLHPVHPVVRDQARELGSHRGFLAGVASAAEFGSNLPADPISTPFVEPAGTVTIRPGEVRRLTLLLLPGHCVHATCGIVPRKRLELSRAWVAEPLGMIVPSFRVGPVLVDASAIRMPPVSALAGTPDKPLGSRWTRRETAAVWRDDPITAASDLARLPDAPAVVQEGWVRAHPVPPPES